MNENDEPTEMTEMADDDRATSETTAARTAEETDLLAQFELLRDENRRLRAEYARARQVTYRRTALGMGGMGLLAVAGGLVFPAAREVLVIIGATGLFAALLTYYLTPERFVAADVGERVYTAAAQNHAAIATALGLRETYHYIPVADSSRLFVPLHADASVPDDVTDRGPFHLETDDRGLLLDTSGGHLFQEFERALAGDLASTPTALASQLCDGLVEQFELATAATPDVSPAEGRVTVAIDESAFGDVNRFDHPIPSFLATGFAIGLERPVRVEIEGGEETTWLVTCRFETDV
ncbi:hypothetical protein [Natronosalvus vescus]|uniref:hypothetical protein n=1 Tax=Natronosalvus vescus TaxID=2953881 RepID=UPI002091DA49|nr:hypothetical protein [Natronosalvus vescus]